jgi:hypothetical protein
MNDCIVKCMLSNTDVRLYWVAPNYLMKAKLWNNLLQFKLLHIYLL